MGSTLARLAPSSCQLLPAQSSALAQRETQRSTAGASCVQPLLDANALATRSKLELPLHELLRRRGQQLQPCATTLGPLSPRTADFAEARHEQP